MPIEQMNISISPQMARFIRDRVKKGQYTNASEVIRDAVRRMQEEEAVKKERTLLSDFESRLTKPERESIRRSIKQGIKDIERGHYEEYDDGGLRNLAKKLVSASVKKLAVRSKAR